MTDTRKLILDSDYPMDKVIDSFYFDETITGVSVWITVPHGFNFVPLPFGFWCPSNSFDNARPLGGEINSSITAPQSEIWADEENYNIRLYDQSQSFTNFRCMVFAFEPSGSQNDIEPNSNRASKFLVNSDFPYLKLAMSGEANTQSGDLTIEHNLGFTPQCMLWGADNGDNSWGKLEGMNYLNTLSDTTIIADNNSIKLNNISYDKVQYRIYYDEA